MNETSLASTVSAAPPAGGVSSPAAATTPASSSPIKAAVVVRGARKCYAANKWVLDGMDLTVPEASIYALLGASGCGKTTLLTCILGLRHLNAGAVKVMGVRPGAKNAGIPGPLIGYMPQELALSENFTIGETLTYFGRVAGLADEKTRERSDELLKFLDIPAKKSRLLSDLSGGQKQRVSLAVTLLHAPPLLILDEPTVGVDPILRQSIWDFLVDLTRTSRTTVIITTHYIEEARQANLVGLMRRGRLLDEDGPDPMMAKHDCKSLEDVFLNLSMRQDGPEVGAEADHELQPLPPPPAPSQFSHVKYVDVKPIPFTPHSNILACMWRAWLQYIGNLVRNALFRAALKFHDDMQQGCGLNSRFSAIPIEEMEPVYGSREPSFQDFALPGVLQCVMYFPAIFYATANFMEDKLTGVMNRAGAAGVTQFEMLAARAILDVCLNAVVTVLVLFTAFVAMGFTNGGSYLTLTALLYVQGLVLRGGPLQRPLRSNFLRDGNFPRQHLPQR
ncbi:ABC-transporter, subfamily H member 07 [Frankliniella occidentalis]|nr:ABC-transporter, subfamily H member 07 [Frankliniella occidentalis]